MKEKPILFSTDMVKAILDNRKTMTRRIVKLDYSFYENKQIKIEECEKAFWSVINTKSCLHVYQNLRCPYGEIGSILWLRETWLKRPPITYKMLKLGADTWEKYYYKADLSTAEIEEFQDWGWKIKPSIHMPKVACRIKLKITDIKIERLGKITEEDIVKEGIILEDNYGMKLFSNNISAFASIWCKVHKSEDAWQDDVNKFVWVISFERI